MIQNDQQKLVFLAGWTRDASSYQGLLDTAPKNYQVTILSIHDLAPAGSVKEIKANLWQEFKDRRFKKVILAGHSLGGAVALEFAAEHPDLVNRLILVNSEGIPGLETEQEILQNFFKGWAKSWQRTFKHNLHSLAQVLKRPKLNLELARHAYQANFIFKAKMIKVPTLILWGADDMLTPLWQAEALHWYIARSTLKIFYHLDHDWILHHPDKFWLALK